MPAATLTGEKSFRNPTREMKSVLTPIEARCLRWLATRLPVWVTSDQLTVLALGAMAASGAAYAFGRVHRGWMLLAIVGLAVNWFGDSLDGTLARLRRCERPRYGFYVDHVVDALGAACLIGGLGASGYMSPVVALALFAAYLLLCVEIFLRTCCLGSFQMSFFKIGPTELRILLAIGTAAVVWHPDAVLFGHRFRMLDVAGTIGTAGLVATFLFAAAQGVRTLYRAEPLPPKRLL